MSFLTIRLDRVVPFSPVIVWDALVDADLVAGWLGDARIEPVVGGRYDLAWLGTPEITATSGKITRLEQPTSLVVVTDAHGTLDFSLTEVPGGPRGTSTVIELTVGVDIEHRFEARVRRVWLDALDQLDALLHGHPADWGIVASAPESDAAELDVAVSVTSPATRRIRASNTNAIETGL